MQCEQWCIDQMIQIDGSENTLEIDKRRFIQKQGIQYDEMQNNNIIIRFSKAINIIIIKPIIMVMIMCTHRRNKNNNYYI